METKYTAERVLEAKENTFMCYEYQTALKNEEDAQMIADILSVLGERNISINHASAVLNDCETLLGLFGRI
jgi:hypothetical protein